MKIKHALLAAVLTAGSALATTATPDLSTEPALSKARLKGSLTLGAATNYTGKGYVVSRAVAGGEGIVLGALKMNYDIGKEDYWSIDSTIAYKAPTSGHTLYGNPVLVNHPVAGPIRMGEKNIENEFAIITAAKYTRDKWNVTMGHQFVHGGLYGVMAKHYRNQGSSDTNEIFVAPEWTPYKWLSVGVKTSLSFKGLYGWWFEPYVTMKAPIVGTPEDIKVAGVMTIGMSATTEYYNYGDFACSNGSQAFWIQFSTPWFVNDSFILTPSVGFHWLGKGGLKANEKSHVKQYTKNDDHVPFKRFGVVGTLSGTYKF